MKKSKFKIKEDALGKTITVYNPLSGFGKFLYGVYLSVMIAVIYLLFSMIWNDENRPNFSDTPVFLMIVLILVMLAVALVYILCIYQLIKGMSSFEKIHFDGHTLQLRKGIKPFLKVQTFEIDQISGLRYLEEQQVEKAGFTGNSFDYLGLETEQKAINEMYKDERIEFIYEDKPVRFGKEIVSWELEELVNILQLTSKHDLSKIWKKVK